MSDGLCAFIADKGDMHILAEYIHDDNKVAKALSIWSRTFFEIDLKIAHLFGCSNNASANSSPSIWLQIYLPIFLLHQPCADLPSCEI
jgi:hypothetical protein